MNLRNLKMIRKLAVIAMIAAGLAATAAPQTFRLYRGVTVYVNNPDGRDFEVKLDLRDLNLMENGPREVLCKIYTPDGRPAVRELIPDDGITKALFPDRIGGWDHELQYYANLYAKGTLPALRWSAWSEPERLEAVAKRTFTHRIAGGQKGVYRIVLAGTPDHYATINISPELKYGVSGHTTFIHGHANMLRTAFIYVPKGTNGIFMAVAEPDLPQQRHFRLTAPDGKVLFDGKAVGGYTAPGGKAWKEATLGFGKAGEYDGKLLRLEVSDAPGDYLLKITLQQPLEGAFKDYVGMGSLAVYAPDEETAMAIQGGSFVEDGEVFWHPFQARLHRWLKANPLAGSEAEKALRTELETIYNGFRLFETSDGRGSRSWTNWAYAFGYYGCKIWRPAWLLMQRPDLPAEAREILMEGLIMGGDRLAFATGMEKVNGNSFTQINVALWYCHRATGDALQKQLFETFWQRWSSGEGWGPGAGLSRSGDSQEHFSHDCHYGSYLMDNWRGEGLDPKEGGSTWLPYGILADAKGLDDRFEKVIRRYRELYTYLYCRDTGGHAVAANPWSSRTHMFPHQSAKNWELDGHVWKGEPGPDFTVSVNGGDEWFAARRKNYYMLTFHGRLAPEWMSRCFEGQLGFGGGIICQLTVPGKGPVLASTLADSYGKGMDPSNWRNFHIHSIVGERWDGAPLIAGITEHENARLEGNTVRSSGEVRNAHMRVSRGYTFNADHILCEASLAESEFAAALSIWSHGRKWSEVRLAYEMIPFLPLPGDKTKLPAITLKDQKGADIGTLGEKEITAQTVRLDRGGFGVEIELDQARPVSLGANHTLLIRLTPDKGNDIPAAKVAVSYKIVPFGN